MVHALALRALRLLVAVAGAMPVAAAAQPAGTPDLGFGSYGLVETPIEGGAPYAAATDVAIDPEGRIVVVGWGSESASDADFTVVRYLPDGQRDPGFGGDGIVTTPIGPASDDVAVAVVIQPDGRIVVAGTRYQTAQPPVHASFALVRYLADGSLDTSFGAGGIVVTTLSGPAAATALALQPDGKLLVAGFTTGGTTGEDPCIVRYHTSGFLDSSFGTGGVVRLTLNDQQWVTGMALTSTGRVVLSASSTSGALLIRLRSTGELDDTFGGGDGLETFGNHPRHGVELQPDGKIVMPGTVVGWTTQGVAVARHHPTGTLDTSFAADGVSGFSYAGVGYAAVVQPNGKIVVAGVNETLSGDHGALWRVDASGVNDFGFQVQVPGTGHYLPGPFAAVAVQPDGKLVAVGPADSGGTRFQVARYHGDAPDLIFKDGFESGTMTQWSSRATDGSDLFVVPSAGAAGTTYGLRGQIDDTAGLYVQDDTPSDEGRYRARFYLAPGDFDPGEAQEHRRVRVFIAFDEDPMRRVAAIVLRRLGGTYSVRGRARLDDDAQADTPFVSIDGAMHVIEFELRRSSGPDASDGSFQMWVDGAPVATLTGLDNSSSSVDFVRLGALSVKPGASGTLHWDEFESRRETYIGP